MELGVKFSRKLEGQAALESARSIPFFISRTHGGLRLHHRLGGLLVSIISAGGVIAPVIIRARFSL